MPTPLVGTQIKVWRNGGFRMGTIISVSEDEQTILVTQTRRSLKPKGEPDEFIHKKYGIYFKKGSCITHLVIAEAQE